MSQFKVQKILTSLKLAKTMDKKKEISKIQI